MDLLLIDDDDALAELLRDFLTRHGHAIRWADSAEAGWQALENRLPRLILLDVMLPGQDGFQVLEQLRSKGFQVPVIMLTAKGDSQDRVSGLRKGADDYVAKPFGPDELLARIEAVLRRSPPPPAEATYQLDPDGRTLLASGRRIALTPNEYKLMGTLIAAQGRTFSRDQILEILDETGQSESFDRSVDLQISRLRQKLEVDPRKPKHLLTVWGVGYRFQC